MLVNKHKNILDLPVEIKDKKNNTSFKALKLLGKGSFGKCYLVKQDGNEKFYACKMVPMYKFKSKTRWKMVRGEILIQSPLMHRHIVSLHRVFQDACVMYTLLDVCTNGNLKELQRRRKYITPAEARYYVKQILLGVDYLHRRGVVHGDLKLGNILLDCQMSVKIADFGFSDIVESDENIIALQGTANYMAPEIVEKTGHSKFADIWAVGCILYYLVVGKPPFHGHTDGVIFKRITSCDVPVYQAGLRRNGTDCFKRIFQKDQYKRPSAKELLRFDFFRKGFIPHTLPRSCLFNPPGPKMFKYLHFDKRVRRVRSTKLCDKRCSCSRE